MYEFVSLEELELQTNTHTQWKKCKEREKKKTVLADVFTAK